MKFTVSQGKSGAVAKACKKDGCTIAVYRVSSVSTSTALVKVASKNLRKGKRLTIPFTIKKSKAGSAHHLIVLIKNKRTGVAIASIPVRW